MREPGIVLSCQGLCGTTEISNLNNVPGRELET